VKPIRFYLIAVFIIIADQVTKWAVIRGLPLYVAHPVLGNFLWLTHTRNTGGAFSLFPARNATFIAIAMVAIGALVYAYQKHQRVNTLVSAALGLALGGAIGNLIDRIRFGYVVDFVDIHVIRWPVFNVADSAITVGIFLLAWHFLFAKDPVAETKAAEAAAPSELLMGKADSSLRSE
jgi:signal peptidase II